MYPEISIYDYTNQVTEEYKSYEPDTLSRWKSTRLAQFDAEEVGTKAQLEERRDIYEKQLEKEWRKYRETMHRRQGQVMDEFKQALATAFFVNVPVTISDLVYSRAWDEGHSSGLREVTNCYGHLANFVEEIITENNKAQRAQDQNLLQKG